MRAWLASKGRRGLQEIGDFGDPLPAGGRHDAAGISALDAVYLEVILVEELHVALQLVPSYLT